MVDAVLALPPETRLMVLAPVVRDRKGEFVELFAEMQAQGYVRFRVDGQTFDAADVPKLKKTEKHDIDVVIDRIKVQPAEVAAAGAATLQQRLAESFEAALRIADGRAIAVEMDEGGAGASVLEQVRLPDLQLLAAPNSSRACSRSTRRSAPARPATASAMTTVFDAERVVAFPSLSLASGAVKGWDRRNGYTFSLLESVATHYGFDIDTPFEELPAEAREVLLHGSGADEIEFVYEAAGGARQAAQRQAQAPVRRHPAQPGAALPRDRFGRGARGPGALPERQALPRLRRHAAAARGAQRVPGRRRERRAGADLPGRALHAARGLAYFERLALHGAKAEIADKVVREIRSRLKFLNDVGLNYLSLDRSAETLSGGEAQRIRLASQIGSGLTGVMYVLDEPSIGLHQRDNERLIGTLRHLRDIGNSVLVVEHDEDAIRAADHVIDMGPGAGVHGGRVMAQGTARGGRRHAGLADRPLPLARPAHPGAEAAPAAAGGRLAARRRRARQQPEATSTSRSRSACSPASPASRARASRRWSTTRSTPRSPSTSTTATPRPSRTTPSTASTTSTR